MIDLSKIEFKVIDHENDGKSLRGRLLFTVELNFPRHTSILGDYMEKESRKHILFRIFNHFYGEIKSEIKKIYLEELRKIDYEEGDNFRKRWSRLLEMVDFNKTELLEPKP